jgi:glycosyltransferase involved in cell wall biosynthesis
MSGYPKVSIILSVFRPNLDDLKRTIDSISNQTFLDYELLVVKDDAEQETLVKIQEVKKTIKNLIIIDNIVNIGLVKSLNIALKMANGSYIARIDVGDWWHSQKLYDQYRLMQKDGLILTGTQVKLFSVDLNRLIKQTSPLSDIEIRRSLRDGKNPFVHSSVMFKKIDNIFYNEDALHTEDFELWCRYSFIGRMECLKGHYTNYIVDINSITGSKRYLMFANSTIVYINFLKCLHKNIEPKASDLIAIPVDKMSYLDTIFSKLYSASENERMKSRYLKYLMMVLLSIIINPKVLFLMFKRKLNKLYYA